MHDYRNLQLQIHQSPAMEHDFARTTKGSADAGREETREWISAFSTSILTTQANGMQTGSLSVQELMQTPEFASIIMGARHLADSLGLSKEESTERLIEMFRKIDSAWTQAVLKRGIKAMID